MCNNKTKITRSIKQIKGEDLKSIKTVSVFENSTKHYNAVSLKGSVYIVFEGSSGLTVTKQTDIISDYSADCDSYRRGFCVCALLGKIYVIGGVRRKKLLSSCVQYDPEKQEYKEMSGIGTARNYAACALFEGKIVVSGGSVVDIAARDPRFLVLTRSNEAYDHVANAWSHMPNMMEKRNNHSLVAVKSKLFVVGNGRDSCEVFDRIAGKFSVIRSSEEFAASCHGGRFVRAAAVGSKIVVFGRKSSTLVFYDIETDEWSRLFYYEKNCELGKNRYYCFDNIDVMPCLKVPRPNYFLNRN